MGKRGRYFIATLLLTMSSFAVGCGDSQAAESQQATQEPIQHEETTTMKNQQTFTVKVHAGNQVMTAQLEDNPTTRAFMKKLPVTLHMQNLYGREMCYRYGANALPTGNLRSDSYQVGDIAYWPPRGSLVILYKQNGEHFERQQIGHIASGAEMFANAGAMDVTFEAAE